MDQSSQNESQYAGQGMAAAGAPPGMALGQIAAGQPAGGFPAPGMSYQHLQQQQQRQMQEFWMGQMQEVQEVMDFKTHSLPLARIKKIMKADEDVRMISGEAPVLFAKACEMFILELTLRAWMHTEENKRRTLQKNDIAAAVTRTDIFDFLVDIVPREDVKDEALGVSRSALPIGAPDMQYYMIPGQTPPGVIGRPAIPMDPALYAQQQRPPMQYMASPQQQQQQQWQPDQQAQAQQSQAQGQQSTASDGEQ
ncbi:nuclear transcription factor Y subunit C-2 [Selaginella moellendorffii]|nr:nuclear transcription factor Y subunit C-2 [Selaginella moellendorffii]|eukprot:XP_024529991.1 nuclear transcription factor Y subunit C-2 [Selaginella moellendorffii]